MSRLFPNHSVFSNVYKHDNLPIYKTNEFDFYRCVPFNNNLYGKTVSNLHSGNLRANDCQGRYSKLFPNEKISYWSDNRSTARTEVKRHNRQNNLLTFWAYDDATSTFPTIENREELLIIDGIELEFSEILGKIEDGKELSCSEIKLLSEISDERPDCLAYKSHAKNSAVNFLFFEKGFYKLSIRDVRLRLGDRPAKNTARIACADSSDYSPSPKNYGKYFESVAKVRMDEQYMQSGEYISRNANYKKSLEKLFAEYDSRDAQDGSL